MNIFIGLIFIIVSSAIIYYVVFPNSLIISKKREKTIDIYTYKLEGAVKFNEISSEVELTYRELFFKAKILSQADLSNINLEEKAPINALIFVPFENSRITWKLINSYQDFYYRGITKRISELLWEFKQKNINKRITWDDIANIKGIGLTTLTKLKKFLILE
ncbi:hypothetical protein HUN03_00140 [Mycoplasmopsis anatis]|uniref:Helix-hairpin-helix domain-containing protein n=4 Tax=Mycoplasmopsis anatis TaxID=171279 RepID=A0A9Q3QD25_9BACT|nr:hypothetical protein [Mycoplasmopsis anatis]AWX69786.1 hypothetical protein DP067_00110 [Mycoplasmopsis anatis]MBW0594464.1 hypothetical protein [Mycoplasmopsis anatis]MBW0595494.1 hypothetical protein [Mycoplasmopsis anatis]MBW0596652.1 hypothetical protein [Mycoplasmopsis anatis]MBW0598491.1 hypothetical protein [Mycoplasmopsis anatis]